MLHRFRLRSRATIASLTAALFALLVTAGSASAGPASVVFSQPGGPHDWVVPEGVTEIDLDAVGGSGGRGASGSAGGAGARVQAGIPVVAGTTLHVHVAGNGALASGGANGGGGAQVFGGGGGGASDVRIGGDDLASRILVAAGGGGAAVAFGTAGSAGEAGTNGGGCTAPAAQPGTASAGGAGGGGCDGSSGTAGTAGSGGNGGTRPGGNNYGGGGGGGYYGGGGGGAFGGGAGGSNLVPVDASNVTTGLAAPGAAPYVRISYVTPPAAMVTVSASAASVPADGTSTLQVTAAVEDRYGNARPGDSVEFSSSDAGMRIGAVTDHGDGTYTATVTSSTTAGSATITATDTSGTPVSGQTTVTVTALSQTVAFSSVPPTTARIGESYTVSASGGGSGNAVVFSVGAATTGAGTSAAACSLSGQTVSFDHAGACVLDADQAGNAQYAPAPTVAQSIPISQAASTSTITVHSDALVATVRAVAPATGVPTGTVTFAVDGTTVGTAPLQNGAATLQHTVAAGQTRHVAAIYSGDADYVGSSASTARHDPSITAHVSSTSPRNRAGWYRTPVTVTFKCVTAGAALTTPCPGPVTLGSSASAQSVTRTILAQDGGAATASVQGIKVDTGRPTVRVRGVRSGAVYLGTAPPARCVAGDAISGINKCRLTLKRHRGVVRYTARAVDRAGNAANVRGRFRVLDFFVQGARYNKRTGAFRLRTGHTYTLVAHTRSNSAPRYYEAAPDGVRPGPAGPHLHRAGTVGGLHRWTARVHIEHRLGRRYRHWAMGVKTGKRMHLVRFHLRA